MFPCRSRPVQARAALLCLSLLAACVPAAPTLTTASQTPVPISTTPPSTQTFAPPTATTAAPDMPTAARTTEPNDGLPLIPGPDVEFQGVQLHLPTVIASEVRARLAPAEDKLGELYPPSIEFTLPEYNSINTWFEPQVKIYPVRELSPAATETVQQLKDLLAERPVVMPASLPILPVIPAGQLIHAQVQYLTFASGSAVRVLTQFAQDAWPINNEGLVYVFLGLTRDDSYYVSAFLPVRASFLPDHVDDPAAIPAVEGVAFPEYNSPNFNSEHGRYQQAITQKLNSASSEEFVPPLLDLDELMQSVQVESVVDAQNPALMPCVNGLPTRLRVDLFAYVNPDPPLPNNLRRDAGKVSSLLGEIQPGQAMKILEGPKCADGWVWWRVRTLETELVGWTAEGDRKNYWLIPCASRRECGP